MFGIFKQVKNALNFEQEFDKCESLSLFKCCFAKPRPFETHDQELLMMLHRKRKPEANYYGRLQGISPNQAFVNMLVAICQDYMEELGVSSPPEPLMYSLKFTTGFQKGSFYCSEKLYVREAFREHLEAFDKKYFAELDQKKRYEEALVVALSRARSEIPSIISDMDKGVFSKELCDIWISLYRVPIKFGCIPTEVEISKLYNFKFEDVVVNMRALVDAGAIGWSGRGNTFPYFYHLDDALLPEPGKSRKRDLDMRTVEERIEMMENGG